MPFDPAATLNPMDMWVAQDFEGRQAEGLRLVIVSHASLLEGLSPKDDLAFSTDFLAWTAWRRQGGQAVHFEGALGTWPKGRPDPVTHYLDSVDWTDSFPAFGGIPLDRLLAWEIAGFRHAWLRLWHALDAACTKFKPKTVVLRDARVEYDLLDRASVAAMLDALAQRHGFAWQDDPPPAAWLAQRSNLDFQDHPFDREAPPPAGWMETVRHLYALVVEAVFRLNRPRKKKVLFFNNFLVLNAMLNAPASQKISLSYFAAMMPKRWSFLKLLWKAGASPLALRNLKLGAAERNELEKIRARLCRLKVGCKTPLDVATAEFVAERLLKGPRLLELAIQIKQFALLFRQNRFYRVVIGDSENGMGRLIAETAKLNDVAVDEHLNGMFLTKLKMDARNGSAHQKPVVDRLLSWGPVNERWLKELGGGLASVVTGYAVPHHLAKRARKPSGFRGRALVLPLHIDRVDLAALYADVFSSMVETVRELAKAGFTDIRVKVHPGFHNLAYYEAVVAQAGLTCTMIKEGPLAGHIEWADVVLGPVNSGALVETLAMNVPYVAMMNAPTSLDPSLFPEVVVQCSPVEAAAAARLLSSAEPKSVLEAFCSFDSRPDPAQSLMTALEAAY